MDNMERILTRKSVRTFDGRRLSEADLGNLRQFIETIRNPYAIPVQFVLLDAEEHGLSSPVIQGEHLYIAGKVPKVPHCEEAFGHSFEQMVLYAWSLGIGTTWIGGTLDRALFEQAAGVQKDEIMMIVSPLGYPAAERSEVDQKLRDSIRGDERLSASELFYEKDFATPLKAASPLLEAVRWAPSAANMQPCRVVKEGDNYHFYEKHTMGYTPTVSWDVQKIDLGIAVCHFMTAAGGRFAVKDPGIACGADTEYIATVTVEPIG